MKFLLIPLFCFISLSTYGQPHDNQSDNIKSLILSVKKNEINLTEDYSYYHFNTGNDYLVWYEGYTKQIYYHDLEHDSVRTLNYKKGRGPFEIGAIKDLVVIQDHLYILDIRNFKLIIYDLVNHKYLDEFSLGNNRIYKIETDGEKLYGIMNNPESFFYEIDFTNHNIKPIEGSTTDNLYNDIRTNAFRNDGLFLVNKNYLLLLRYYEPSFIYYSFKERTLVEHIYDEVHIKPEYTKNAYGIVDRPPQELSMVLNSAYIDPVKPIIYYTMRGETKNIKNGNPSYIYSYDFVNEAFLDPISTQLDEIKSLVINDDFIIAHDSKKFLIKKIEF